MTFGWMLLAALTASSAFSAVSVAVRARASGRAETFLASALVFFALIIAPVFVLGYTRQLDALRLALSSIVFSAAAFVASARGRGLATHARDTARTAASLARMPLDALTEALRARSLVALGLLVSAAMIAFSLYVSYLAPSEGWDGLFYHEPIVGFAIQNHGFSAVRLQQNPMVQTINGYPRGGEAIALFFVIFTDRTFIEIGNTLASPCLVLAVFVLARRYGDRVTAMGWGAVTLFVPAMWSQLHSAYTDIEITFFLIAALAYAARPELRMRDVALASLAMTLLLSAKGTGLTLAPPIALVAFARLVWQERRSRLRDALLLVGASLFAFAGVTALTLLPNALRFHNPIWPVTYENAALGLRFKGLIDYKAMNPEPPLRELLAVKYGVPKAGIDDIIGRDYGYAVPYVVAPLGALAVAWGAIAGAKTLVVERRASAATDMLLFGALALVAIKLANSWSSARFNLQPIVIAMIGVQWLAARRGWSRFGEGAVAAALILSMVPFVWVGDWYWGPNAETLRALRHASREERASMYSDGSNMDREVALAREREIGRGDVVAFTQEETWLGVLWNFDFSNVVRYVPFDDSMSWLAKLDEARAKWVVVGNKSAAKIALESRTDEWEPIGAATRVDETTAFRRRRR